MKVYLVAKNKHKHGCLALKTDMGKNILSIENKISVSADKGIQLVTISRPTAFGEYAPYNFVDSETEFIEKVKEMAK